MDTTTVTAAQLIRPYRAPQWLIEPTAEPADAEEIEAINACEIERQDNLTGWAPYSHVITATDDAGEIRWYVATIPMYAMIEYATAFDPHRYVWPPRPGTYTSYATEDTARAALAAPLAPDMTRELYRMLSAELWRMVERRAR